jgi:hypothetical protein
MGKYYPLFGKNCPVREKLTRWKGKGKSTMSLVDGTFEVQSGSNTAL